MIRFILACALCLVSCENRDESTDACPAEASMVDCPCPSGQGTGNAVCSPDGERGPCLNCDESPPSSKANTPLDTMETVPPFRIGTDNRALGLLRFDATPPGQRSELNVLIRAIGTQPVLIRGAFLKDFEECDYSKHRRLPSEMLPDQLDSRCPFAIIGPDLPPSEDADDCLDASQCPYAFELDGPAKLKPSEELTLGLVYRPTQGMMQGPIILVIETDVPGAKWIEYTLEVKAGLAQLQVRPTVLAFPDPTTLSTPLVKAMRIQNVGAAPLVIANIIFESIADTEGDADEAVLAFGLAPNQAAPPYTLAPGAAPMDIEIEYTPLDDMPDEAYANILSPSAGAEDGARILLTSNPVQSELSVSPMPVNFSAGTPNAETGSAIVRLKNTGTAPLTISKFTFQPNDEHFAIRAGPPTPIELMPTEDMAVELAYTQQNAPLEMGTFVVMTDAANGVDGSIQVPLLPPIRRSPAIRIEPRSIALHDIRVPAVGTAAVVVSNPGIVPLEIRRIALTTPDDPERPTNTAIALTGGQIDPSDAFSLQPDEAHMVEVTVARSAENMTEEVQGFLDIDSNAYNGVQTVTILSKPIQ